jgi:hypothetical protein
VVEGTAVSEAGVTEMAASSDYYVEMVSLDSVFAVGSRRPVSDEAVASLAGSIEKIGLRTPITVRIDQTITDPETGEEIGGYAIVTGAHRVEACRRLGWEQIPAIVRDCTPIDAELWEIAENLHRADLTKEQRDQHIRRYAELLAAGAKIQVTQTACPEIGYGKPPPQTKGIASQIAEETGVSKDTVRRALNPDRVQAERSRAKIDADVKTRAAREVASMLSEHVPGEWWDALKANLYAAGAANIANELTNITGQSIMDRRYS